MRSSFCSPAAAKGEQGRTYDLASPSPCGLPAAEAKSKARAKIKKRARRYRYLSRHDQAA